MVFDSLLRIAINSFYFLFFLSEDFEQSIYLS